jgi:hypothetical protein
VAPELFARMHIRDVHLDEGCAQFRARVTQRHRGVGEPAGVEDHRFFRVGGRVDPFQQLSLVIALSHNSFEAERGGFPLDQRRQLLVRRVAVHVGLASAQPAQIGAVDHLHVDVRRRAHDTSASPA